MTEKVSNGGDEVSSRKESENSQPFQLSIATFNAGNGKRGIEGLKSAMDRMVSMSSPGAGILGFQELPPRFAGELANNLPEHWEIRQFPNPTDSNLSMAIGFDSSQLELQNRIDQFVLPPLSAFHNAIEFPKRKEPLQREAQILHFVLKTDPLTHIIFANAHLSVRGRMAQRQQEMDVVMAHVRDFMQEEGLVDRATDESLPGIHTAVYIVGDFNTPGRVGSKRNIRHVASLQLFEQGFSKLNDHLEATSNVLSSVLHKAHDVMGDQALDMAKRIGTSIRRGQRQTQLLEHALKLSQQHRDHIFGKLYGLTEDEELEKRVFSPPEHPRESDHFMVFAGSMLRKTIR